MKKLLPGLALVAVGFSSVTFADATPQDVPATLSISGKLNPNNSQYCQVVLDKSVINLNTTASGLIEQGQNGTSTEEMTFSIYSIDQFSRCDKQVYEGKIAVRFTGAYDNADGTAFANTAAGDNAAAGVGIGLFNYDKTPLDAREIYKFPAGSNSGTGIIGLQLIKLKGETTKTGSVAGNITFQIERL
ncbi:fimbrial protein [Cronobacter turicensis]|nr:type 1 fimbrial protein [Cronobacter turicensis]